MTTHDELKVTVELTIVGTSLSPEEVTKRVGLSCDRFWRIGDPRGRTGKTWTTHGWAIRSVAANVAGQEADPGLINRCTRDLIDRLRPVAAEVRELSRESDVGFSVNILASDVPALSFDREVVSAMAEAGGWLEIDLILWDSPGDTDEISIRTVTTE